MEKNEIIMIVAGEDSGDLHAANLVSELKKLKPNAEFIGLGGPKMSAAGVTLFEDLTKISVVGFFEVLKHYSHFKQTFDHFLNEAEQIKPSCVILVDYPGFNLRLAKKLKVMGIKVIYYISPQVWAWKKNRIKDIKKYVDQMLVIFDFEKDFYLNHGFNVEFVGHPLLDTIKAHKSKEAFLKETGFSETRTTIGLLPGSRRKEIDRHLPVMLKSAKLLYDEFPQLQFLLIKASAIDQSIIETIITQHSPVPLKIIEHQNSESINACDLCMVASGTATLEVALFKKPMIIIYKTSWITWLLAKLLIKIPFIGLVNVLAGKLVAKEFIQHKANPSDIAAEIKNIFTDEIRINEIKGDLESVRNQLDLGGASKRAAEVICKS